MNDAKYNMTGHGLGRRRMVRRSCKSRGAVLVLALLGGFMIVGMIGYVFNAGRHAQLQQQTQSAADATVISGAGYVARSFNTVAMNNVEIARLIASVQLFDAVPQSVDYAFRDSDALLTCMDNQLDRGTGDALADEQLREIADELREAHGKLEEMDIFFNRGNYDIRQMTFYDSEFGTGEMWKAMDSLDAISLATMESLEQFKQTTAIQAGKRNLVGGGGERLAAVAPFGNPYLWQRHQFDDFRGPVLSGRLPDWVDDPITNRGPCDTIFGWHRYQRGEPTVIDIGPMPPRPGPTSTTTTTTTTTSAGSPWSGGPSSGRPTSPSPGPSRRVIVIPGPIIGYTTYGIWEWLSRQVPGAFSWNSHPMGSRQFASYVRRISAHKLNYLWPNSIPQTEIYEPQWITDYNEAVSKIRSEPDKVRLSQWIRMDFERRYVNGVPEGDEVLANWVLLHKGGTETSVPGAKKLRSHVWEDESELIEEVTETFPDGKQVKTVYKTEYRAIFIWAGIDIGEEAEVRNPNNFASREDLAAPLDLDHDAMQRPVDGALGYPGSAFTFLGLATQPNHAPMWRGLFNTSAYDGHTGIAQASVFNNHSWDLWTQMWHAQLEPVQDYSQWVDLIESEIDLALGYDGLSVTELEEMAEYLRSLEVLAPIMLTH